jgi:hypothetical protein
VWAGWTQFGFDDDHTRFNPYENVLSVRNFRRMELDGPAQLGSPVFGSSPRVVDGVAYVGSSEGSLWAVDATGCGSDLCTQPLWRGDPSAPSGRLYVFDLP